MHGVVHADEIHASMGSLVGRPREVEDGNMMIPIDNRKVCICIEKKIVSTCVFLRLLSHSLLLSLVSPSHLKHVPMQEYGLLPFQANKEGVHQLHDLGEREERDPQTSGAVAIDPIGGGTDSLLKSMRGYKPQQVRDDTNGPDGAIHC